MAVENGKDPVLVANDSVALILNEPNMLFRQVAPRRLPLNISRSIGQTPDVRRIEPKRSPDAVCFQAVGVLLRRRHKGMVAPPQIT